MQILLLIEILAFIVATFIVKIQPEWCWYHSNLACSNGKIDMKFMPNWKVVRAAEARRIYSQMLCLTKSMCLNQYPTLNPSLKHCLFSSQWKPAYHPCSSIDYQIEFVVVLNICVQARLPLEIELGPKKDLDCVPVAEISNIQAGLSHSCVWAGVWAGSSWRGLETVLY